MNNLIETQALVKRFGVKTALGGVDFSLPQGCVAGLLGPNGSGKTTLLKILSGLSRPTSGSVNILGEPISAKHKASVAFLPDNFAFPAWMRVVDAVAYFQAMYPDFDAKRCDDQLAIMQLNKNDPVAQLSKGLHERLLLALTLARNARIYLLDEPLGGIDPVGKAVIMDAIIASPREESSMLISTHLVKDIERIFDRAYFLRDGVIAYAGDCDDMRAETGKTVESYYLEVFGHAHTASL